MARLTERELDLIQDSRLAARLDRREVSDILIAARQTRADFMASLIGRALTRFAEFTGLAALGRDLSVLVLHPLRQALLRRRTAAELGRLSGHLLRDIGLERSDIEVVAERLVSEALPAPTVRPGLLQSLRRWRERRRVVAELKALDDRMLADMGLERGNIEATVTALYAETATPAEAAEEEGFWASVVESFRQWNLSRQAAGEMARLGPDTLSDLGYVKGDVDWVPEVLAERSLQETKAA
jgi:uncharacterized protein YjiS (DUF1127 family)